MRIRFEGDEDRRPRNRKDAQVNNKAGLRNKGYWSPQQASRARLLALQIRELVRRASLAWAGTGGIAVGAWVAAWHIIVRRPVGIDLFLGACAAIILVSFWMLIAGCHARFMLEQMARRR